MFNFGLGAIVGFFIAFFIFASIPAFDLKTDLNLLTNATIAAATIIATLIHFDSQKKQRIDRIWDMNKSILLDLTHSLSKTIEATNIEIQNGYTYPGNETPSKKHDWNELSEKINYVLNVYSPLIDDDLKFALNQHKKIANQISWRVDHEELDSLSAYEEMLIEHSALYEKLLSFIARISGISLSRSG